MHAFLMLVCSLLVAIGGQQVAGVHHHIYDGTGMMHHRHHHMLGSFNSYLLKKQYENMLASRDKSQMVLASNYINQYPLAHGISSDLTSDYVYPAPPRAYETMSAISEPHTIVKLRFRRPLVAAVDTEDDGENAAITVSKKITIHDGAASVERSIKLSGHEFIQSLLTHARRQSWMTAAAEEDEQPPATMIDMIKAHATVHRVKTGDDEETENSDDEKDDEDNANLVPGSYNSIAASEDSDKEAETDSDATPYMLPFNTQAADQALNDAQDPSKRIQEMRNVKADYSQRRMVEDPDVANDVDSMHDSAIQHAAARQKRGVFGGPVAAVPIIATPVVAPAVVPVVTVGGGVVPIGGRIIPFRTF